jgi:hypothetical protein
MQLEIAVGLDLLLVPGAFKGFPKLAADRIRVYTKAEFDDLFQAIWLVHHQLELFLKMLDAKPPERDELRSALCRESPNRGEIHRLLWGD